ncbi:MAG: hypothetical protein SFT94_05680 [Pseudanabaenaceae cyanobacterium bins.68]|nr:hypothetical protein [Pseudanabaenaceae cyanobacterium bins.68]
MKFQGTFNWLDYCEVKSTAPTSKTTVGDLIARLERDYFADRDSPSLRHTWNLHYIQAYKRLPQDQELNESMLIACLIRHRVDTRSKQIYYKALNRLIKFVGLDYNLEKWRGTYSSKNLKVRDIPDDDDLLTIVKEIDNLSWRWVFSLMLIYGLRPHECWHVKLDYPRVNVLENTKTGARVVYPIPEKWIKELDLEESTPPVIKADNNCDYGASTCQFAKRNRLPVPYTFSHAYAIRMIHVGVPDTIAAAWMGHTLDVHNKKYQRWLSDRDHQKVFENLKQFT